MEQVLKEWCSENGYVYDGYSDLPVSTGVELGVKVQVKIHNDKGSRYLGNGKDIDEACRKVLALVENPATTLGRG